MPKIALGPWEPDRPPWKAGAAEANNVYPSTDGYVPFAGGTTTSDALSARCQGAIVFEQVDGTVETIAGDGTKLYRLSGSTFNDVSGSTYSTASSGRWRFAQYGDLIVATNGVDKPQSLDVTGAGNFADITGAPEANFVTVVRDFLVMVDVQDGSGFEIKWSARNDSTKWTVDCGAGSQDVPDGGPVVAATGGEIGVILQKFGLTTMRFVGGDLRFTFDKIEGSNGCIAAGSVTQYKGLTFYLSDSGFEMFNGSNSRSISTRRVSDHFFDNWDSSRPEDINVGIDQSKNCIVWGYPTSDASTGQFDKLIIYNFVEDKWSEGEFDGQHIMTGDSVLSGFDTSNKLIDFTGSNLAATVTTGEREIFQARKGRIRELRALTDANHTISIGTRDTLQDDVAFDIAQNVRPTGKTQGRAVGRYARMKVEIPAGESWNHLTDVDVEASPGGKAN